jgi:hypothetical protein
MISSLRIGVDPAVAVLLDFLKVSNFFCGFILAAVPTALCCFLACFASATCLLLTLIIPTATSHLLPAAFPSLPSIFAPSSQQCVHR